MNKKQILAEIKNLASCNGFYSRLYDFIINDETGPEFLDFLERQRFSDVINMILFLES
jgi:hypothetical protein